MKVICPSGVQISSYLREKGFIVSTPCGSRGNCGKCRVRVVEGELAVNSMDRVQLTEEEIDNGVRLACQAWPKSEVVVELL